MKLNRFRMLSLVLVSCAGLLASCSTPADSSSSASESTGAADSTGSASSSQSNSGVVNVYMPSPAGLQTKIEKGFEAAYQGIDMKVTSGTTGELLAKIEAEKNNPVCDVLILASWSDGLACLNKYNLTAYEPKDSDKLDARFKEDSHKIYGTSASSVGVMYNTDFIDKDKITKLNWSDFGNADKLKEITKGSQAGKMARAIIPDPTKSGAAKDFFAGMLTTEYPDSDFTKADDKAYDLIQAWATTGDVKNAGGNKTAIAMVENGTKDILLAGVDYNAYTDRSKKHVDIYFPEGGTVANARPAMIMASGKNQDNAKKVMDYLCSTEAQQLVADAYLLPGRTDVAAKSDRVSLADTKEFANLDWNKMAQNGSNIAKTIVSIIKSESK